MDEVIVKDPLGGVRCDDLKTTNPFSVDQKRALTDINLSIDWIEGRKRKSDKTVLQRMRDGTWGKEEKIPNWEPSADSEFDGIDVVLRWAGKEISRVRNVSKKEAKIALAGVKAFIRNINSEAPDFTNPLVVDCYNVTAQNYNLKKAELIELEESETIEHRPHPDVFAGIKGDDSVVSQNRFLKDIKRAIKLTDATLVFLEVAHLNPRKRRPEFRNIHKTAMCSPTYKSTNTHFDISLVFAHQNILTEKNIPLPRAKIAFASLRGWLRSINPESPELADDNINKCYAATKERTKPGRYGKVDDRLLPMEEGGSSFWSSEKHCWVTGHFDKNGNFMPPDWGK